MNNDVLILQSLSSGVYLCLTSPFQLLRNEKTEAREREFETKKELKCMEICLKSNSFL